MRVRLTKQKLIHRLATCNDCPWLGDDYHSALAAAKNHAKETGHTVLIEFAYSHKVIPSKS